jgi:hypothetical protein
MGGMRQNADQNSQIRLSDCRRGARNGGSSRHRPPVLWKGEKSANIYANSGFIWGIPVIMNSSRERLCRCSPANTAMPRS